MEINAFNYTDDERELKEQMEMLDNLDFEKEENLNVKVQIPQTNKSVEKKLEIALHKTKKNENLQDDNVEAIYKYINERGTLNYQIKKLYKPDRNGNKYIAESLTKDGFIKPGAKDIPRIPYNVPDLIKQRGRVFFIVNRRR